MDRLPGFDLDHAFLVFVLEGLLFRLAAAGPVAKTVTNATANAKMKNLFISSSFRDDGL